MEGVDGWGTGLMVFVKSDETLGPPKRMTAWRGVMTGWQNWMTGVERSQNTEEKIYHLHSKCLSLRANRTFHAVFLLPVTHTASSRLCRPVVQGGTGVLTSAGFSHNCEDSGHRRTGTDQPDRSERKGGFNLSHSVTKQSFSEFNCITELKQAFNTERLIDMKKRETNIPQPTSSHPEWVIAWTN